MPTQEILKCFPCSTKDLAAYLIKASDKIKTSVSENSENKIVFSEKTDGGSHFCPIKYEAFVEELSETESELRIVASSARTSGSAKHVANKTDELIELLTNLLYDTQGNESLDSTSFFRREKSTSLIESLSENKPVNPNQENIDANERRFGLLKISLLIFISSICFAVWVSFFKNDWDVGKYAFLLSGCAFLAFLFFSSLIADLCPHCSSKKINCDSRLTHQETTQKQKHILNHSTSKWEWMWKMVTISYFLDTYTCQECSNSWEKERNEESI